jgi:uncharacterized NAD(P)/FAD-binding protein YdhS
MTPTILIVGGGFSGVAVTHALARLSWPEGVHVVLADRSGSFGRGAAYSTDHPAHLLNVPAGRMGALADDEGHFLAWLRREDPRATGDAFVPRSRYGDYLEHVLESARAQNGAGVRVETRGEQVVALEPLSDGGMRARFHSGAALDADRVVLAIGNLPPRNITGGNLDDEHCVRDPWAPGALKRVRGIGAALVIGTGLTMVDAVLLLSENNPNARFVAVSRHGLLPLSHRDYPTKPGVIEPSRLLAEWNGSARELLAIVRRESRRAEDNEQDWRDVLNGLRPITAQLWNRMSPREQARFHRHVRPFWDAHRHRMATRMAERVNALIVTQALTIVAGRIAACAPDGNQVAVDVRRRDGTVDYRIVDVVINCTGPDGDLARSNDPLVASLRTSGALVPDRLGIGMETREDGAVIDGKGSASRVLYALGAARRPALWESTAVPELRAQASALAKTLHASIAGGAGGTGEAQG